MLYILKNLVCDFVYILPFFTIILTRLTIYYLIKLEYLDLNS